MANELRSECERFRTQYDQGMTQVETLVETCRAMMELRTSVQACYAEQKVERLEEELRM